MTAPTEKADADGGGQPGQLDRPAQEPVVRAAGAEQVAQQDHLLDPPHLGEGHGIGGATGVAWELGAGGRGRTDAEPWGRIWVGEEERGDGEVEFIG